MLDLSAVSILTLRREPETPEITIVYSKRVIDSDPSHFWYRLIERFHISFHLPHTPSSSVDPSNPYQV